jgi:hypothetical protein
MPNKQKKSTSLLDGLRVTRFKLTFFEEEVSFRFICGQLAPAAPGHLNEAEKLSWCFGLDRHPCVYK